MVTPIYQFTLTPIYSLASYTRKEEKMVSDSNLLLQFTVDAMDSEHGGPTHAL
jgi:hypothetical protein